jgi:hydroxypyruvate reductase
MKTLLIGEIENSAHKKLKEHTYLRQITNEEFAATTIFPEVEVVVLRTYTQLKEEEIEKMPKLKFVVSCSVGTNNLDILQLQEKGIELIHCPGTNANSVAEHTLYLILSLLREDSKRPFAELKGKTVGIVGFGYIGKLVAQKLKGFDAKLIAFDVIEQEPKILQELQVTMKDFDSVLRTADILTIHVPLNTHTHNLINATGFERMKQDAFFINTSREEVINEPDFIDEINEGKFRGIGLDVCSKDFMQKVDCGKNILVTNHVAAQGEESFKEMCNAPIDKLLAKITQDTL